MNLTLAFKENLKNTYIWRKKMENGLRNRNFSTAINCLLFPFLHILFTCFSHFQNAFFHMFLKSHFQNARFHIFSQKCENMWKKCVWKKMWKNACWKYTWEKMWNKMNMWKNVGKKAFENPVGKVELWFFFLQVWFFGVQFCCSYFAAGPNSAGWKSERSSSNRSEVDWADRRSV